MARSRMTTVQESGWHAAEMQLHDATHRALPMPCVAGVLVGGHSRRMGRSKPLLPHARAGSFVEHVVSTAGSVAAEVLLLGSNPDLPASLDGLRVIPDVRVAGGPLAGLCAAFSAIRDGWVLLLACDLPLIEPVLLERLLADCAAGVDAVAFRRHNDMPMDRWLSPSYHACCALYHARIRPVADAELAQGGGSIQNVLKSVRVKVLSPSPAESRQLVNVNTPEDWARVRDHWAAGDGCRVRGDPRTELSFGASSRRSLIARMG